MGTCFWIKSNVVWCEAKCLPNELESVTVVGAVDKEDVVDEDDEDEDDADDTDDCACLKLLSCFFCLALLF